MLLLGTDASTLLPHHWKLALAIGAGMTLYGLACVAIERRWWRK